MKFYGILKWEVIRCRLSSFFPVSLHLVSAPAKDSKHTWFSSSLLFLLHLPSLALTFVLPYPGLLLSPWAPTDFLWHASLPFFAAPSPPQSVSTVRNVWKEKKKPILPSLAAYLFLQQALLIWDRKSLSCFVAVLCQPLTDPLNFNLEATSRNL